MYVSLASWINSQTEQHVFGHIYLISYSLLLIADIYTLSLCALYCIALDAHV